MATLKRFGSLNLLHYKRYISDVTFFNEFDEDIVTINGNISIVKNRKDISADYDTYAGIYDRDIVELTLKGSLKELKEVDYSQKNNFFTVKKVHGEHYLHLYIYAPSVGFEKEFIDDRRINSREIEVYQIYSFKAEGFYHSPLAKQNHYREFFDGRVYFRSLVRVDKTDFGVKCQSFKSELEKINVSISETEAANILNNYNVGKK